MVLRIERRAMSRIADLKRITRPSWQTRAGVLTNYLVAAVIALGQQLAAASRGAAHNT
jgi:hypothetical protein